MRILSFSYLNPLTTNEDMIEIHYRVIELNNRGTDFIFRMNQQEFIRRIDITGI
jgi:hypothetical protein